MMRYEAGRRTEAETREREENANRRNGEGREMERTFGR